MEYRLLGNTGLKVSTLCFGTMTFGGEGPFKLAGDTQVEEAKQFVDECIDAGVNIFDTADIYSTGKSEEVLGKALGKKREKVLVATKLHARMSEDPNDVGQSRHNIVRATEASLKRLGTDYIDILQVHGVDELTCMEQTLKALDQLVRDGKVRYIGCSNFSAWHLMKALSISERKNLERFVVLQAYYSMVARELEYEFLPLCEDQGVGILVWGPLSGGLLSGKYKRGEKAEGNTRRAHWGDYGDIDLDYAFDVVDVVNEIAKKRNVSSSEVALNWLLSRPQITSLIIGARTIDQLRTNLKTTSWSLTQDEVERLDKVSELPAPYPYWHQRNFNAERLAHPPKQEPAKELVGSKK